MNKDSVVVNQCLDVIKSELFNASYYFKKYKCQSLSSGFKNIDVYNLKKNRLLFETSIINIEIHSRALNDILNEYNFGVE